MADRGRGGAVFVVGSLAFVAGAAYHAVGLVRPDWTEPIPPWRHAAFVAVNAGVVAGLLWRPRWFVAVFALLVAQQLYGHSTYGWEVWRDERRVDWASVAVVLGMPIVLALLVRDALARPGDSGT